jgi:hypothetical protein
VYHDGTSKKLKNYIIQNIVKTTNLGHVHGFITIINKGKKCVEFLG